jgi:hypothetical protein
MSPFAIKPSRIRQRNVIGHTSLKKSAEFHSASCVTIDAALAVHVEQSGRWLMPIGT